jgi:predicted  nucleic acid-binding Zn-ribbon protein
MFTSARRQEILAQAHANLAKKHDRTSAREYEVVYKRHDEAVVERRATAASGSEQSWAEWVDGRITAAIAAAGEGVGEAIGDLYDPQFAALKRELEVLRREVVQLREQVGLERELKELKDQVETAKNGMPRLPEIVGQFKSEQARLKRELETTREKLRAVRVDQSVANFRLGELDKETRKQAANVEMKIETRVAASFAMREMHPDAAAALRNFATATLGARQDEKIWILPGPAGGTA